MNKTLFFCLTLISFSNHCQAAEALDPAFILYLVDFADQHEIFDAADYALISEKSLEMNSKTTATQQATRPTIKEQKP